MAAMTMTFSETATPALGRAKQLVLGPALKRAAGAGQRRAVRIYLRALPPNKQGFPSTGFYKTAAESVTAPVVEGNAVTISITQTGFRQRYLGGDINPGPGKTFLTVPAQAISYGKRAPEFNGLKFAYAQDENGDLHPALVSSEAFQERGTVRNRRGMGPKPPFQAGTVVYWLYRHVHQDGDRTILPNDEALGRAAVDAMRSAVRARLHDPTARVEFTGSDS